jgi:hypothetical protein
MTELPERPNGEDPKRAQPKESRRQRSQSRRRDQPPQIAQSEGFDVWQYGEDLENQRRYVLKAFNSARKELTDQGKITEQLKEGFKKDDDILLSEYKDVVKLLKQGFSVRKVMKLTDRSSGLVQKVKKLLETN